jgi:hypothetical protein
MSAAQSALDVHGFGVHCMVCVGVQRGCTQVVPGAQAISGHAVPMSTAVQA